MNLNLKSDALVGFIDRHNYFGGQLYDTMPTRPGSGYFSSGLQQVAGRPFSVSEWIHVYSSFYSTEGPAIMAAYGMGLQGWGAGFEFQSAPRKQPYSDRDGWQPWGAWDADVPTSLGQYPTLARMIYRGDVREGAVISTRRVSPEDLAKGEFSFSDKLQQDGDIKSCGGSVPTESLAVGRCLVEFTPKSQASTLPDLAQFREGSAIVSETKQLRGDVGSDPSQRDDSSDRMNAVTTSAFFTINTPSTKGVVGFAANQTQQLGDVMIELQSPYASIVLTSLDKSADLSTTKRALLSVVARNGNSGFKYFSIDNRILSNGQGPILLEPVQAVFSIGKRAVSAAHVLNHAGQRTGKTLDVRSSRFAIDGARDRALYYEVEFQ